MKKKLLAGVATGMLITLSAGLAGAEVLTFDDIDLGNHTYVRLSTVGGSNYGGFDWDTDWYIGDTSHHATYSNAAHSGTQYLSNGNNVTNLSVGNNVIFDFDGAWFAAPTHSRPASWVNISAYDTEDNLIGSTGEVSISSTMSWVAAGFENVSYLNITRGDGWFTMDDFTYNNTQPVPEPATMLLVGAGLAGVAGLRLRRRK